MTRTMILSLLALLLAAPAAAQSINIHNEVPTSVGPCYQSQLILRRYPCQAAACQETNVSFEGIRCSFTPGETISFQHSFNPVGVWKIQRRSRQCMNNAPSSCFSGTNLGDAAVLTYTEQGGEALHADIDLNGAVGVSDFNRFSDDWLFEGASKYLFCVDRIYTEGVQRNITGSP